MRLSTWDCHTMPMHLLLSILLLVLLMCRNTSTDHGSCHCLWNSNSVSRPRVGVPVERAVVALRAPARTPTPTSSLPVMINCFLCNGGSDCSCSCLLQLPMLMWRGRAIPRKDAFSAFSEASIAVASPHDWPRALGLVVVLVFVMGKTSSSTKCSSS